MKRIILTLVLAAAACSNGKLMRYVPPNTQTDLAFEPATPQRTQLDNGIGVLSSTFEHPATTTLALVFGHGYVHDRVPGTAKLLGEWLQLEADTNLSPGLDAVGAAVSTSVGTTSTRVMVTVEHRDVPAAMEALAQLLIQADSELAFETAKGRRLGALASRRGNPAALARLAMVQSTHGPSDVGVRQPRLGNVGLPNVDFLRRPQGRAQRHGHQRLGLLAHRGPARARDRARGPRPPPAAGATGVPQRARPSP